MLVVRTPRLGYLAVTNCCLTQTKCKQFDLNRWILKSISRWCHVTDHWQYLLCAAMGKTFAWFYLKFTCNPHMWPNFNQKLYQHNILLDSPLFILLIIAFISWLHHYWHSKLLQFRHYASPQFTKQLMTFVSSANAYGQIAQRKLFMFLWFRRTKAQKLTQPWQLKTKSMLKFFYGIGPARGGGRGVTRHPKSKKGDWQRQQTTDRFCLEQEYTMQERLPVSKSPSKGALVCGPPPPCLIGTETLGIPGTEIEATQGSATELLCMVTLRRLRLSRTPLMLALSFCTKPWYAVAADDPVCDLLGHQTAIRTSPPYSALF